MEVTCLVPCSLFNISFTSYHYICMTILIITKKLCGVLIKLYKPTQLFKSKCIKIVNTIFQTIIKYHQETIWYKNTECSKSFVHCAITIKVSDPAISMRLQISINDPPPVPSQSGSQFFHCYCISQKSCPLLHILILYIKWLLQYVNLHMFRYLSSEQTENLDFLRII